VTEHGVEGTGRGRVAVQHVEVSAVGVLHDFSQLLLHFGAEVLHCWPFDSVGVQQLNTFSKGEFKDGQRALEGCKFELLVDGLQFSSVSGFDVGEDEGEELSKEVQQLEVVLLDGQLHVQPYELAHMTVSEGVLSTEHWANLEHALEVSHHAHLLIELGRLG
jgi:hypothetical protein